jgi:regulator of sirC expression with transglutaminase-like and TPR domain
MDLKLHIPSALEYFESLVQSDEHFPLLEAAASLAQDEYPETDVQEVLDQVDQLCERIKRRLPNDAGSLHKLRLLNNFFFEELGFAGNLNNYYDPENSFIHAVLHQRRGMSVSLAVIWLELALSVGLDASGVSFPGHFLVKVRLPYPHDGQIVLDPLSGHSLSKEDLAERLAPMYAESGLIGDGDLPDAFIQLHLRPATSREIVARMLRNLDEIYTSHGDSPRRLNVKQRLAVLLPPVDTLQA